MGMRTIKTCHEVFSVVYGYARPNDNPWGILHKYKSGDKLGQIQNFYDGIWRVK